MNKIMTKLSGLFLGLAMGLGVATGVTARHTANEVRAAITTASVTFGNGTGEKNLSSNPTTGTFTDSQSNSWSYSITGNNGKASAGAGYSQFGNSNNKPSAASLTWTNNLGKDYSIKSLSFGICSSSANGSGQVSYTLGSTDCTPTNNSYSGTTTATITATNLPVTVANNSTISINITNSNGAIKFNTLSFTYEEFVNKTLTSIGVKSSQSKTVYYAGDKFDPTGLVITAKYSDETTEDITYAGNEAKFTFSPDLNTELDTTNNKVTITYGGKTVDQSITVNAPRTMKSIELHGEIIQKSYYVGETWDLTGLDLQVNWSAGDPTFVSLEDDSVAYECDPETAESVTDTSFDIEVLYESFDESFTVEGLTVTERPIADVLDKDSIPTAAIGTGSSTWGTWTEFSDYTYSLSSETGAKYKARLMGPGDNSYVGRMNNSTNGGFYTSKAPVGLAIKSISFSSIAASKNVSVYLSNEAYESLPSTTDYKTTLTSTSLSYSPEEKFSCFAIRGRDSSLDVGSLTIEYEAETPSLKYSDGTATADLTVINGSTNTVTFEAKNFSSVSEDMFSNNKQDNSSLAYSVSGTTVTVTVTGLSVGDDAYTINATGCDNTLILNVTVQTSTTFDSLVITTPATSTTFNEDDPFAVTDLVITANYTIGGISSPVVYSEANDNLDELTFNVGGQTISLGDKLTSTGTLAVVISYTDNVTGTTESTSSYNITVNAYVAHTWTKVTTAPSDWRGTYLLGYEHNNVFYAFNTGLETFDVVSNTVTTSNVSNDVVTGSKTIDAAAIKIERNTIKNKDSGEYISYYHALCANGEYLKSASKSSGHQKTATETNSLRFDGVSLKIGDYWLRFNTSATELRFRFGSSDYLSSSTASLYKMDTTNNINNEVSAFVSNFDNQIGNICDYQGVSTSKTGLNTAWSSQKTAFNNLSVDAQGILANTTYTHNGEEKGSTKDIIDRYDYICEKYLDDLTQGDFMNRIDAGTLVISSARINPIMKLSENQNIALTIVIISLTGLSAVGCFFFYRKRKEI